MNNPEFADCVYSFFMKYLPLQRGLSQKTIASYSCALMLFYEYCEKVKHIRQHKLTFEKINKALVEDFCLWLEIQRHNSGSTRNQRLAALRSLFFYIQSEAVAQTALCRDILSIPEKKTPVSPPRYLTVEETTILFSLPDIHSKHGRRDLALLLILYDSGARAEELTNLRIGDIMFGKEATVKLFGKGSKTRIIPIMPETANILKGYMKENKLDKFDQLLFENRSHTKLTTMGISYILNKYITMAKTVNPQLFRHSVSPHLMRSTKGSHLIQGGANIYYVRDFLGHVSVITTERYVKNNPEVIRKAIEEASANVNPNSDYYDDNAKQTMTDFLKTFR
jgi:integrase/recombinase XerD